VVTVGDGVPWREAVGASCQAAGVTVFKNGTPCCPAKRPVRWGLWVPAGKATRADSRKAGGNRLRWKTWPAGTIRPGPEPEPENFGGWWAIRQDLAETKTIRRAGDPVLILGRRPAAHDARRRRTSQLNFDIRPIHSTPSSGWDRIKIVRRSGLPPN
jgi:hypothetical protein